MTLDPEVRRVLTEARALIADPERWTTQVAARGADGIWLDPDDEEAVRWCAYGAVERIAPIGMDSAAIDALNDTARRLYPGWGAPGTARITVVNDCVGHAAVLSCFDAALADEVPS